MADVEHVLSVQNELGEGPVWHSGERALYWVDIEDTGYYRFDPASGTHEKIDVGVSVATIAFRAAGGFLLATKRGLALWDAATREFTVIGNVEAHKPNRQFNDGAVDRRGRFWIGTTGDPFNNALYRLDPDRTIQQMETGIDISNGIGWSPDDKTMYYTDSTPARIYAYDFDAESGAIANRRIFVESSERVGLPDGLTVDREGFVWSARWGASCIERYDPAGKLERSITLPAQYPSSLMFGGDDLRDLYITSARIDMTPEEKQRPSLDGDLFRVRLAVGGFAEPAYAG
ncbi:MAG: SMP-30/gluconolactonase/LRE family protein [Anaerolineae bacterium]